jgi:pimeloyl-ACP methyl ester carboxylesterase
MGQQMAAKPKWWLGVLGLALMLAGAFLANAIRTSDGVTVKDIRFAGAKGAQMSALLYVPKGASPTTKVPGILAVHGYINSRETQDGFAIEFARRGYVVLSIDQRGHGYSDGPAFADGFGGPAALAYLHSLPMVDISQIGLEGHSMGGWTVLAAAAAAMPDGYRSMVLQGSSTGKPFAQDGSPIWPRNMALVFSKYDEFSQIMWGVDRAMDVNNSAKLQAVFGSQGPVVEGRIYGQIADGSARVLYQPATTHPGNHISPASIGHATDWFAKTLKGGTPRAASDQIWLWKEFGTGIGLIGFVMILLGVFDALIRLPYFASLQSTGVPAVEVRDRKWWRAFALNSGLPALLFFPTFIFAYLLLTPSAVLPQAVTTQVTLWALTGAGISLLIARFRGGPAKTPQSNWLPALLIAIATVVIGYAALLLIDRVFHTDIRFWVVAVKLPSVRQLGIAAIYVVPLTLAFLVTLRTLCSAMTVRGDGTMKRTFAAVLTLTSGFILLLGVIYGLFFATGSLITAFDPLSTVIALQFVPVLAAIAVISMFTWERTNSHRAGGLIVGMLVTLYVVAGTATQV